jgi:tRNA pseudouridine13 synthase
VTLSSYSPTTPPPLLTSDVPGTGGIFRQRPEDFLVEEQPLYQPSGQGEHIYLFLEKRGVSTMRAARILASHFGVHVTAVGFAGLKDKNAITRQVFSIHVPGKKPEDFPMLQHDRMAVLWVDLHANKLRRGHLATNRFSIKIRNVDMSKAVLAAKVIARLEKQGLPNRIGEQRFGYLQRNHLIGRAMLLGDHQGLLDALLAPHEYLPDSQIEARRAYARGDFATALQLFYRESRTERRVTGELSRGRAPGKAVKAIERNETEFFLTAFQSAVFNAVLDERLRAGTLGTLMPGDVAFKHDNRACFDVTESTPDLVDRLATLAISPSGPMWGAEMKRASGEPGRIEVEALQATGVTIEIIAAFQERRHNRLTGERRPLRVPLLFPDVEGGIDEHGHYIRLAFDLPRGAFATSVLQEVMKPGAPLTDPDSDKGEEDDGLGEMTN